MLDIAGLNEWMAEHFRGEGAEAFRLETLQVYEVATDGSDFKRWLRGAPEPTWERKRQWFETLDAERADGRQRLHVRLVTRPITPYTAYECAWGYALNVEHGQSVRILDLGERAMPDVRMHGMVDWWLVTDGTGRRHVLVMRYDEDGQFSCAEPIEPGEGLLTEYVKARDALWDASENFALWYARHPELHRPVAA